MERTIAKYNYLVGVVETLIRVNETANFLSAPAEAILTRGLNYEPVIGMEDEEF